MKKLKKSIKKKSIKNSQIDYDSLKIRKCISVGSYGIIKRGYICINKVKTECAIKEVQSVRLEKFKYESGIISDCNHINIVKTYGYMICLDETNRHKATGFIIMELCQKKNLLEINQTKKSITNKVKIKYLKEIVQGMVYLHSMDIVHRDLKLSNILIGKDKKVKICDFGTSKNSTKANKTFCGTPSHMAPELCSLSLKNIEHKLTDIYSFGILIWELWACKEPYIKEKMSQDYYNEFSFVLSIKMKNIRPNLDEMINPPDGITNLARQCWYKDSSKRPQSFEEILTIIIEINKKIPDDISKKILKRSGKKKKQ